VLTPLLVAAADCANPSHNCCCRADKPMWCFYTSRTTRRKLWQAPQTRRKFTALRAEQINLLSREQALQLYRLLVPSG
jgi:hypothetical protein